MEDFVQYKKGFILDSRSAGQSNNIPQYIRRVVNEVKENKLPFRAELIDHSSLKNTLLPFRSLGKKPKLATKNLQRSYQKGAKFTVIKSIESESSYGRCIFQKWLDILHNV